MLTAITIAAASAATTASCTRVSEDCSTKLSVGWRAWHQQQHHAVICQAPRPEAIYTSVLQSLLTRKQLAAVPALVASIVMGVAMGNWA